MGEEDPFGNAVAIADWFCPTLSCTEPTRPHNGYPDGVISMVLMVLLKLWYTVAQMGQN